MKKNVFSILLNEEITSGDDRLNYESYKNLLLKCKFCHQAVFFKKSSNFNKQGIKRVAHFSHYKDIGYNPCPERTESNTSTGETDSEGRKQSLEKYQKRIQDILYRGIVFYQKITFLKLEERIKEGEILINQYEININKWLNQFYEKRGIIKKLALTLYHNKSSQIECDIFSNIVYYLCFPASVDILKQILYYVFLFDKEVFFSNDFDKVSFKALTLISYIKLGEEYLRAKESLAIFNEDNITEDVLTEDRKLESEIVEPKMVTTTNQFGQRYIYYIIEEIKLDYYLCTPKLNKKGERTFHKIRGRQSEEISISWREEKDGGYLILRNNSRIVATFSLTVNRTIKWNPLPVYFATENIIARPLLFSNIDKDHIESDNLYQFFLQWIKSDDFIINRIAWEDHYPSEFIKLLFIFIAYMTEYSRLTISTGDDSILEKNVDVENIDNHYNKLLHQLVGDSKLLKNRYLTSKLPIPKLNVNPL
ncbi:MULTISPECIES: hypothetical protein [unclassified Microcoleus]|uniref:hypothetical protein n=1 Tax=unclassified Microcoleus TaxID=2642155 RepID=UPI002FD1620C